MFDFSHLPSNASVSEFVFKNDIQRYIWHKPPNCRLVLFLLIGAGGGGAGGAAGLAGTSRNGGGGGGAGGLTLAIYPGSLTPAALLISTDLAAGRNGNGGASNSSGAQGPGIRVSLSRSNGSDNDIFLFVEGGGGGSTNTAGQQAFVTSESGNWGNCFFLAQWAGGRDGTWVASGLPSTTSIGTSRTILGGGGGGGVLTGVPTVFNGAGFTSDIPAILPDIPGGLASSALNASSGVRLPFISVGGAGGGGNDNGPGGRGGNGVGYGSGGGGGGAGVTGQGGRGGDGGPAYACIIAW